MRVYPQAVEAERALLGGMILKPERIPELTGLGLRGDHFHRPEHANLFRVLVEMHGRAEAIDLVTVPERIGRDGEQDKYGGISYVLGLPDQIPSTTNLPHYARVVIDKALLRQLIDTAGEVSERAYAQPDDVHNLMDQAAREILSLGSGIGVGSWEQISLTLDKAVQDLDELSKQGGVVAGYTTGFEDLDKKLAGLHKSDLLILAARPAMGKTALALNVAQNVALMEGRAVGIFSMEMSRAQLVTRMVCCQGMVDGNKVRTGKLDTDDWARFLDATDALRAARVFIDDTPGLSITDVRSRAKRLKAEQDDLGLIVIDYLQLMSGDDKRAPREQQISAISRGLKALAKDVDVPVIALSQLNRGVEQRAEKRPMVSDLRESGAIEQDADIILFIYRDEYYNPDSTDKGLAEVIIAKQRSGPTGTCKLVFRGEFTRFDNYADDDLLF
ncbi:MAG: replicative DNA helicase [Alphaproteobacteria bacterium]|nr:replicative DNA helicase [Alphaproteobacteria bacterium]